MNKKRRSGSRGGREKANSGGSAAKAVGYKGAAHVARNLEDQNEEEGGLSGGAIAGIVSAVVLVVLFILLWKYKRPYIMQIWKYITQIFYTLKKTFFNNGGTAENIDPIAPLPKPLIWKCLGETSKLDIQSNPNIKSKEVYTFYNGNMLFYKDDQGTLHQFETSGLTRPKKLSWSKRLSKRLPWRSKNGANNDETYTTIIREGELFPEGEGELTLPNSGLQSDVPGDSLKPGQWCLARLEQV